MMNPRHMPLIVLLLAATCGFAGDFTNRYASLRLQDGQTYSNARPQRVSGDNLVLFHSKGIAYVEISQLPEKVRSDLHLAHRSASPSSEQNLSIPALYGRRPAELKRLFPRMPATKPGSSAKLSAWRGWKAIYFGFNGAGRLASISFTPATPLSETEAKRIVKEYGVSLPESYEKRAPALVAYRNMQGRIKTVNFSFADWRTKDNRISEIGIFFNIGWDE